MNYSTYHEIKTQTVAWQQALENTIAVADSLLELTKAYGSVIFTGCGSTYYLSLAAAALYQKLTGVNARAVPGGELLLNPAVYVPEDRKTLLIAISRSGTTTETIKAVENFLADDRGEVITITNYPTKLSTMGKVNIIIEAGQENSVAQTRSFASMYVAAATLSIIAAGRQDLLRSMHDLPAAGNRVIERFEETARGWGEDLNKNRIYFLGSGILYGLACEVNLKMKEMSLTHSEPFHFLEFRHGPMSMVNENTYVVGLLSKTNAKHELQVLEEMRLKGAQIISLADDAGEVQFDSGIPEECQGVLYLPVLQFMGFFRSLAKGNNPDRPHNLTAVVKLDL